MTTDKAAAPVGAVPQGDDDAAEIVRDLRDIGKAGGWIVASCAADLIESQQAAIASQAARMGELEKDAARWRFLRDDAFLQSSECEADFVALARKLAYMHGSEADAAIDALLHAAGGAK